MTENNHKLGIKLPDVSKNYCQGIQIYIDRERINNAFGLYPLDREVSRIENFDGMDLEFDVLELEVANVGEIARFMNEETFNKFCELWRKYHGNSNCNLTTCRYNQNGICQNEDKRKECVEVSLKVLCLEDRKENE